MAHTLTDTLRFITYTIGPVTILCWFIIHRAIYVSAVNIRKTIYLDWAFWLGTSIPEEINYPKK